MAEVSKNETAGDGGPLEAAGGAQGAALTALVIGALTLGLSPIFVRLSELGPTATAFHRVFLALPLLWLWQAVDARRSLAVPKKKLSRRDYAIMALGGFFFAGDLAFWHWSLQFTAVANATLLATMAPIWVTLGAFFLFGERFSRTYLIGLIVAIIGAGVLMGGSFRLGLDNVLGDFLGLVTGIFFGAYMLTIGRLRAHFSTASIMFLTTVVTAVILLPVTLVSGESLIATTYYGWAVLLALALLTHVGGQGAVAYALAHLPTPFSSVGMLLEALGAAFLAWVILGEALDRWQILGAVVVIVGILLARRGSRRNKPA
ncbi:MAG: DMT family transporter [Rhodospirillaceae bacterium]|nr:DMT family transporter [Rhodospirillaceae bacterium]